MKPGHGKKQLCPSCVDKPFKPRPLKVMGPCHGITPVQTILWHMVHIPKCYDMNMILILLKLACLISFWFSKVNIRSKLWLCFNIWIVLSSELYLEINMMLWSRKNIIELQTRYARHLFMFILVLFQVRASWAKYVNNLQYCKYSAFPLYDGQLSKNTHSWTWW